MGQKNSNILEELLRQNQDAFETLLKNQDKYQIQIIYTQINRDENNQPHFTSYTYGVDDKRYFYPASTVKMPTAFVALEKLNNLNIIGLDKKTPLRIGAGTSPQTPVYVDTSAQNHLPSVEHYIKKIFLVSDNDANNRLYEFCGQAYLNQTLHDKGFTDLRIIHRLGIGGFDAEKNQYTNPITFFDNDNILYRQGEVKSSGFTDLNLKTEVRGVAHLKGDSIIPQPFDFRYKNFISLKTLQDIQKAVLFPNAVSEQQRFNLTESDYKMIYKSMATLPKESDFPKYNEADNYCKFFIFGDKPEDFKIPDNIRIFNKVGWAYGFLTDISYIVDFEENIEFMVAAVIHVNENETYNDGVYEYKNIGLPFFANLGQVLYDYEKQRKRQYEPNLERFQVLFED